MVAERFESVYYPKMISRKTAKERIRVYGFLRGNGDFNAAELLSVPEPCPVPTFTLHRSLDQKGRLLYGHFLTLDEPVSDNNTLDLEETNSKKIKYALKRRKNIF